MKILASVIFLCLCTNLLFAGTQQDPCTLPEITYSPENIITCEGIEALNISVATANVDSYQWKKGNTPIESQAADYISIVTFNNVSLEDAGEYTVDVTNVCGTVTSNIITLTVKPEGNAGHISGNESLCSGEIPSLISNITLNQGDNGSQTYIWLKKSVTGYWGIIPGESGSSYAPAEAITESYMYRRMTNTVDGCFSNIISKNVYNIGINDPGIICSGTEVEFSGTTESRSEDFSNAAYNWHVNDLPVSQDKIYKTSSLKNNDNVKLIVTESNICPLPIVSNTIIVQVNDVVTPTVSIRAFFVPKDICGSVDFGIFGVTNAGYGPIYRWMKNGETVDWVGNSPALIYDDYVNGDVFSCEMTSRLPCVTTAKVISNSLTAINSPYPSALISINTPGSLKEGQNIVLKAVPSEESPYSFTYNWYKNGDEIGDQNNLLNTSFKSGDIYSVEMIVSYQCLKTYTSVSAPLILGASFSTMITGPVTVSPTQTNVVYSVPMRSGMSYEWTVPSTATIASGQGTSSIVVNFGTASVQSLQRTALLSAVSVTETNAASQKSTISLELSVVTGTKESQLAAQINLYPVPVLDKFHVQYTGNEKLSYTLYDAKGLELVKGNVGLDPIEIQSFPAGIYNLLVQANDIIVSKRIIKH